MAIRGHNPAASRPIRSCAPQPSRACIDRIPGTTSCRRTCLCTGCSRRGGTFAKLLGLIRSSAACQVERHSETAGIFPLTTRKRHRVRVCDNPAETAGLHGRSQASVCESHRKAAPSDEQLTVSSEIIALVRNPRNLMRSRTQLFTRVSDPHLIKQGNEHACVQGWSGHRRGSLAAFGFVASVEISMTQRGLFRPRMRIARWVACRSR